MNVIQSSKSKFILLILMAFVFNQSMTNKAIESNPELDLENRVMSLGSVINFRYTDDVKDRVYHYIDRHKRISATLLGRVSIYFPLFEMVLKEKGLPEELKYLAVLESGLIPSSNSRVGAAGLWQFMKPTAELVGLKVNSSIDERRDPVKSTYAAADYLKFLFDKYNDWTLAIAAYNCGEGNVNKAIRKADGVYDYWEIQKYLPKETRMYVPKFIAIKYMMNYYYLHDIEPVIIDKDMVYTATVRVKEKMDLKLLAKSLDIDFDIIKNLNPAYTKNFIPASENGDNFLTIPESKLHVYLEANDAYNDMYFVSFSGNPGDKNIPELVAESNTSYLKSAESPTRETEKPLEKLVKDTEIVGIIKNVELPSKIIRLQAGQSLQEIAEENGTDVASLLEENDYDTSNPPKIGDLIRVRVQ